MNKQRLMQILLLPLLTVAAVPASHAEDRWTVRIGLAKVAPSVSSEPVPLIGPGSAVDVEDSTNLGINLSYALTEHWAIDILGALPFQHDVVGDGIIAAAGKIGSVKHLPPTFGLQYRFRPGTSFRPYVGVGLNWTTFFSEQGAGPVTRLSLDDSFGVAYQIGADFGDPDGWFLNFDARMINIRTTANTNLGSFDVTLDPVVVGINVGRRF